jgi:hypothetical protein
LAHRAPLVLGLTCILVLCRAERTILTADEAPRPTNITRQATGPNPHRHHNPLPRSLHRTIGPARKSSDPFSPPPAYDALEVLTSFPDGTGRRNQDGQPPSCCSAAGSGRRRLIPIRDFLLDAAIRAPCSRLRQALLDVLLSLGLPEVEDVALQLLASARGDEVQ